MVLATGSVRPSVCHGEYRPIALNVTAEALAEADQIKLVRFVLFGHADLGAYGETLASLAVDHPSDS